MTTEHETADRRLEEAQREIEGWRKSRVKLGPMPAKLWAEAISLARALGVARVAGKLEMNHGALSRRVGPSRIRKPLQENKTALSKFVEFTPSAPARVPVEKASTSTVIELTSASGERLTLRVSQSVDIGALVANFQARQ
jgi:hypothetical protein